jgi:hypothetical protein
MYLMLTIPHLVITIRSICTKRIKLNWFKFLTYPCFDAPSNYFHSSHAESFSRARIIERNKSATDKRWNSRAALCRETIDPWISLESIDAASARILPRISDAEDQRVHIRNSRTIPWDSDAGPQDNARNFELDNGACRILANDFAAALVSGIHVRSLWIGASGIRVGFGASTRESFELRRQDPGKVTQCNMIACICW